MGYPDPTLPNISATHQCYDHNVEVMIDLVEKAGANVMVASHNQASLSRAASIVLQVCRQSLRECQAKCSQKVSAFIFSEV